jgi:flagellum-specific ATP synthase
MSGWGAVLEAARPERSGTVSRVVGLGVEVRGLIGAVGDLVSIGGGAAEVVAEVVAAEKGALRCMPLSATDGLRVGERARSMSGRLRVPVGPGVLGRVIDGLGRPIDDRGPIAALRVGLDHEPPSVMDRTRIAEPLATGVRAIDTLTPLGRGQRMGLFAGSGVGKSSLLSMIARGSAADANVIALVGERGREVREFIEDDLGPEGLVFVPAKQSPNGKPLLIVGNEVSGTTAVLQLNLTY